jgi:hypothetical protein
LMYKSIDWCDNFPPGIKFLEELLQQLVGRKFKLLL